MFLIHVIFRPTKHYQQFDNLGTEDKIQQNTWIQQTDRTIFPRLSAVSVYVFVFCMFPIV